VTKNTIVRFSGRIIGVDPGTNRIGLCVIDAPKVFGRCSATWIETITTNSKWDRKTRIVDLYRQFKTRFCQFSPLLKSVGQTLELVLETAYVGKFPSAALALGESRGTVLAAAYDLGFDVTEYTPGEAKAAVGAKGNADKQVVARMVRLILRLNEGDSLDATDAAALAIRRAQDLKWM
jgi:crossover junction endodeoxyribonuclease RuvC